MDCSLPGSSFMGFSRQEYWSEFLFPSPGDLPIPEIKPVSLALAGRFFTSEPPGKLKINYTPIKNLKTQRRKSRLLPAFPKNAHTACSVLLCFPPRPAAWPHMKDAGSEHLPPSRYNFPETTHCAAPAWAITDPSPIFSLWWHSLREKRREFSRKKCKTQYFHSNFSGPVLDFCTHPSAAMRRGPACPTAGILFIPQILVIQIKEVVISPYSSPMPITFAFISCVRILFQEARKLKCPFQGKLQLLNDIGKSILTTGQTILSPIKPN